MTSVHDRTARFLDPLARRRREIVTPEGVVLHVELAEYGERVSALLLDIVFLLGANIVLFLLLFFVGGRSANARVLLQLALFAAFLMRNLYFIHFELAWQGVTPGKRIVGLRVIDRHGGPLLPTAVIARNLTRELEAFMPLQTVLSIGGLGPGVWERLALVLWLVLLALLPFFNRDRLRCGDLLAGTMVIAMPKRRLLDDLVEGAVDQSFTERELRAYGAFELQVLEELLRRPENTDTVELRRDVCERIRRKIGRTAPVPPQETAAFLQRFYAAQRAFLEREQLYGRPIAKDEPAAAPPGGA
jgi:uncharacterized RDD family membrane protein YckC